MMNSSEKLAASSAYSKIDQLHHFYRHLIFSFFPLSGHHSVRIGLSCPVNLFYASRSLTESSSLGFEPGKY